MRFPVSDTRITQLGDTPCSIKKCGEDKGIWDLGMDPLTEKTTPAAHLVCHPVHHITTIQIKPFIKAFGDGVARVHVTVKS
jgi:hypothetical protein